MVRDRVRDSEVSELETTRKEVTVIEEIVTLDVCLDTR